MGTMRPRATGGTARGEKGRGAEQETGLRVSKQTPALVSAWPHVSHEMTRPSPCRIMSRAALYQWHKANGTLSLFFALYGPG